MAQRGSYDDPPPRCVSSLERSWPYQRPVYSGAILALRQAPGDPWRAARASRPRAYSELASHCRRLHTADSTAGLTGVEDQRRRQHTRSRPHERAGRTDDGCKRGRLYRRSAVSSRQPAAPAILHGLARRTAPCAAAPQFRCCHMIAARWADAEVGRPLNPAHAQSYEETTVTKASKAMNVGERGIYHANVVIKEGTDEEIAAPQWEPR